MDDAGNKGVRAQGRNKRRSRWGMLVLLLLVSGFGFAAWQAGVFKPAQQDKREPAGKSSSAPTVEAALTPPSFDIVRAEPTGELLAAGRAAPNAEVRVVSQGKVLGTAKADEHGEWVIQPEAPLPKGEHTIALEAVPPGGAAPVASRSTVAVSVAGAGEKPLIAVTEPEKPTRVLQQPEIAAAAPPAAQAQAQAERPAQAAFVAIATAEYEEEAGKGTLFVTGTAPADKEISVYIDNVLAGTAKAGRNGRWTLQARRNLSGKSYAVRADLANGGPGGVSARAEIAFEPSPPESVAGQPAPSPKVAAAAQPAQRGPADAPAAPQAPAAETVASPPSTRETAEPAAPSARTAGVAPAAAPQPKPAARADPATVTIRRGDTLWDIASRHYGKGYRYTRIYRSNKGQIRNPNLIYPNQRIILPK